MRCFLRTTAIWAGLAALAGAATVGFGLFNVSARIGHLPPVHWALHTTFEQNVRLRAPSEAEVPANLGDPGLAAIGAGHFDSACRFCHASPGEAQSATALSMNPAPPHVSDAAASWEPNQLHWIVDNGVKMSGMPHWPTETRDDDVWAVVAFLDAVPDMGNDDYEAMRNAAAGESIPPVPGLGYCATCHGVDGRAGGNPHMPRLDIQNEAYLLSALETYRKGTRESGIMHHAARAVDEGMLAGLAAHYASQTPVGAPAGEGSADGEALASGSDGGDVPSCKACHGPWPEPRNPAFPEIAGQHKAYFESQLRLWRDHARVGNRHAELMALSVKELDDDQIRALAAYYAALDPITQPEPPAGD
ncbi:c-type cytochrome [Amaricoccus macauensis]|uniref:c-type cytochrome n=1 Tax=Amaricoccus macauensis TaxID=57001 RepID=UPI003C7B9152